MTLSDIETKYQFTYPELYKQMYQDGFLDWGFDKVPDNGNWFYDIFPTIKNNPPFLLYAKDFEPMSLSDVAGSIEGTDGIMDKATGYFFVPFGVTGAGDEYSFFYNAPFQTAQKDVPIALVWHDDDRIDILAKNLQDFIFRVLLESVYDIEAEYALNQGNITTNILETHKPYLLPEHYEILQGIFQREKQTKTENIAMNNSMLDIGKNFTQTTTGLIFHDELQQILQQTIGFSELNQSFHYKA